MLESVMTKKKEEWQIREKHFRDFTHLVKEFGFLDSQGRVLKWDGKKFYPAFKNRGHTSCQFESCECYQNWLKEN